MAALYERHGLRAEDRAAMLVLDLVEFPVIFWGSMKAGIVPIPLNTLLSTEVYNAILMDSRARALFVSAELLPCGRAHPRRKPLFAGDFCDRAGQARRHFFLLSFFPREAPGHNAKQRNGAKTCRLPRSWLRPSGARCSERARTKARSGSIRPARREFPRACGTSMAA